MGLQAYGTTFFLFENVRSGNQAQVFLFARQKLYQDQDLIFEVTVSSRVLVLSNKFFGLNNSTLRNDGSGRD